MPDSQSNEVYMPHPSSLYIGFNPVRQIWGLNPRMTAHLNELESYVLKVVEGAYPLPAVPDTELCVALHEVRQTAPDRLFKANESLVRRDAQKRKCAGAEGRRLGPPAETITTAGS